MSKDGYKVGDLKIAFDQAAGEAEEEIRDAAGDVSPDAMHQARTDVVAEIKSNEATLGAKLGEDRVDDLMPIYRKVLNDDLHSSHPLDINKEEFDYLKALRKSDIADPIFNAVEYGELSED